MITLSTERAGITFSDGETVNWCFHAGDRARYCGSNTIDTCFSFIVNIAGPVASIVSPARRSFVSCPPESLQILIRLWDPDGVSSDTFSVYIDTFEVTDLTFERDTLSFYPPSSLIWRDGDTVTVSLVYSEDLLGNRFLHL
jgi:hypothetical protein